MIPRWFSQEILEGESDTAVWIVQRKVGAPYTGVLDGETASRLRGIQHHHGLTVTGSVNAETAEILGEKATAGLVPAWYGTEGAEGWVRRALHAPEHDGLPTTDLIRQFQSAEAMTPTGSLDLATAIALADLLG